MNDQSKILWNKAMKWRWIFNLCPFVRDVYVVNSVARGVAHSDSDIDLLIVTDYRKVLKARFFLILFTQLFMLRVHHNKIAGRFCLSFLVDSENDDLQKIMLPHDPLLKNMLAHKKLLFSDLRLNFDFRFIRKIFSFLTPDSLIAWHTNRAIARAQKGSFPCASVIISPSIFKFHENDKRLSK